jgi:hypothetical protein
VVELAPGEQRLVEANKADLAGDRDAGPGGSSWPRPTSPLATALGTDPVSFPGGHIGFLEDPEGFATRRRAVLR